MSLRIGITGFGRIGRLVFRAALERGIEVAAINDLMEPDYIAYMLKYDSVHGRFNHEISHTDKSLVVDGKAIPTFSEMDPGAIPWMDCGAEYLIDGTGVFTTMPKASAQATPILLSPTSSPINRRHLLNNKSPALRATRPCRAA